MTGCLPVDRSGRPTCTQPRLGGRSTGSVDRQRASALWKWPQSTGRSTGRELCSLYPGLGRPAGRPTSPTVENMTVEPPVDRPVDRKLETESRALCRPTGAISREQKLSGGRSTRSTGLQPRLCARSVHIGRSDRSTDFCCGRPADSQVRLFWGLKTWLFAF